MTLSLILIASCSWEHQCIQCIHCLAFLLQLACPRVCVSVWYVCEWCVCVCVMCKWYVCMCVLCCLFWFFLGFLSVTRPFPTVSKLRVPDNYTYLSHSLSGAREARGQILVFLDSHCECGVGWLQPLLQALLQDRKKVADHIQHVIF